MKKIFSFLEDPKRNEIILRFLVANSGFFTFTATITSMFWKNQSSGISPTIFKLVLITLSGLTAAAGNYFRKRPKPCIECKHQPKVAEYLIDTNNIIAMIVGLIVGVFTNIQIN